MARRPAARNKASRELVSRLSDAIIGIKPLKAMGREDEFARLFRKKIKQIRDATRREIIGKNLLSNLQEPLLMIMMAGGFYVLITYLRMPISTVLVTGVLLQRTVNYSASCRRSTRKRSPRRAPIARCVAASTRRTGRASPPRAACRQSWKSPASSATSGSRSAACRFFAGST